MKLNGISQAGHPNLPPYYDLTSKYKQPNNTQQFETNAPSQCAVAVIVASLCVFQAPSSLGGQELMLVEVEAHNTIFLWNKHNPTKYC